MCDIEVGEVREAVGAYILLFTRGGMTSRNADSAYPFCILNRGSGDV